LQYAKSLHQRACRDDRGLVPENRIRAPVEYSGLAGTQVALIVREHPVVWILATLLVTVVGVILAFQALKECFAQRHPD
jgi:hypothetical protein